MGDMLRAEYNNTTEKPKKKTSIIWRYIQVITVIIMTAISNHFFYYKGYEDGIYRADQCLTNGGKMKADYEEHFICMY